MFYNKGYTVKNIIILTIISTFSFSAIANPTSPYVGQEARQIKSLSKQEVADYLSGKGLGFAKAAELNQFPGPSHVLELANELKLTAMQVTQTQDIFNNMKKQASLLGKQFIEMEHELDRSFSKATIDKPSLKKILADIGKLRTSIRYLHLSAHIEQKAILTEAQIKQYDKLRGYAESQDHQHKHSH